MATVRQCIRCGHGVPNATCPVCGWDWCIGAYCRPTGTLPEDVRRILTDIALYAHQNPTSAERRRLGAWLGIPPHLTPRAGT